MSQPVVETRYGKIEGQIREDLFVFKGIPYAAPPTGDRRWIPPEPMEPWAGMRKADTFGPACPQVTGPGMGTNVPNTSVQAIPGFAGTQNMKEDCLYLNICSPGLDNQKRPVMVWLHAGGFSVGSSAMPNTNPRMLCKRGNLVVVSINYRLNIFGFMNLNEVTQGRIPASGNEGILDQVTALQWVRDNIEKFGGDPNNITVFGESAGGMSVGVLLGMDQAQGLFHKAILESGTANMSCPLDYAVGLSETFLDIVGIPPTDVDRLRKLTTEELFAANQKVSRAMGEFQTGREGVVHCPTVDGKVITRFPLDAIKNGSGSNVPIIIGNNLDESGPLTMNPRITAMDMDFFHNRLAYFESYVDIDSLIKIYRDSKIKHQRPATLPALYTNIVADTIFRIPGVRTVQLRNQHTSESYVYLFDWMSPPGSDQLGAAHGLEVGFVFNTYQQGMGDETAAKILMDTMQQAWIAFAYTGNPSVENGYQWPAYGKDRNTMILGDNCHIEQAPYDEERAAWESVPDEAWYRQVY